MAKEQKINRDAKGRLLPGSIANPTGMGGLREAREIRRVLFESISAEDWEAVRDALLKKSLEGDTKAMAILFSYVLGKPVMQIDMSLTQAQITPEEAQSRVKAFFGIKESR